MSVMSHPCCVVGASVHASMCRSVRTCTSHAFVELRAYHPNTITSFEVSVRPVALASCSPSSTPSATMSPSLSAFPTSVSYMESSCPGPTTINVASARGLALAASGYRNGMDCSVVLYSGAADAAVRVDFALFRVGEYDELTIRDGEGDTSAVLGVLYSELGGTMM